ncbi:MAG TPA: hypothetical protein ENK15_04205 [Thermopetrobacter sp.]|nr:hypothetical protein [Thermopetrobacter sp.]
MPVFTGMTALGGNGKQALISGMRFKARELQQYFMCSRFFLGQHCAEAGIHAESRWNDGLSAEALDMPKAFPRRPGLLKSSMGSRFRGSDERARGSAE